MLYRLVLLILRVVGQFVFGREAQSCGGVLKGLVFCLRLRATQGAAPWVHEVFNVTTEDP